MTNLSIKKHLQNSVINMEYLMRHYSRMFVSGVLNFRAAVSLLLQFYALNNHLQCWVVWVRNCLGVQRSIFGSSLQMHQARSEHSTVEPDGTVEPV